MFFAIELSQAVLFLGTSLGDWRFWVLFLLQKTYTIMRNSGVLAWLIYEIRFLFGRGPSLIEQKRNLERRYLYATADNFAVSRREAACRQGWHIKILLTATLRLTGDPSTASGDLHRAVRDGA